MKSESLIALVMVVVFLTSFFFFANRFKRDDSPRALQRRFKWNFYYSLAVITFYCVWQRQADQISYLLVVCAGIFILSQAYLAFRSLSGKDVLKNYARDPGHCGRCNYDLTGNVSGICPECEWTIPLAPVQVEGQWADWWSKWEIDYLDNWRRTLATTSFFSLAFFGLIIFVFMRDSGLMAIIPAIVCLNLIINSIRVAQYGYR